MIDGVGLVCGDDVDDSVGRVHRDRADVLGPVLSEAPAFDHGRTAHADVRLRGGEDDIADSRQSGVAGEAAAGHDGDERQLPPQSGQGGERRHLQT